MIKCFINNQEIKYDDLGIPIEDKLGLNRAFNETLDTGTIIIPNSDKLSINRLDEVKIEENGAIVRYFLVGTIIREFETFEKPFKYKYTLELVSPTIQLQSIVLPNVSITQPLSITGVPKRSIFYHLDRFLSVFAPDFTISQELKEATENIECPELQWNRKTLFEIFNDLLINVPAVVTVLENKVISLIRLDSVGEEIDHDQIINIVATEKIDEYCSEIEIQAENVIENEPNTYSPLAVSARSSEYILTTDNAQIILDKPIYTIDKLEVYLGEIKVEFTDPITGYNSEITLSAKKYDISKYVLEESVYITKIPTNIVISPFKKVIKEDLSTVSVFNDDALKYKRSFLSFQQGNNIIDNLSFRESNIIGWTINQYALQVAITLAVAEYAMGVIGRVAEGAYNVGFANTGLSGGLLDIGDPRDITFNIEYTTLGTIRFRTKKENNKNENPKVLIDNQSNSYVSSKALWQVEKENSRRVGNRELKINMIINSIADIPAYGATFTSDEGVYILTDSICNVYQEKVIFEGYFTKDFVRKNLYTGLKSKARWTSIAKANEALARKDLILVDYDLTTSIDTPTQEPLLYFLVAQLGLERKDLKLIVSTKDNSDKLLNRLSLINTLYSFGNNLIISFTMRDNFSAGMQIDSIVSSQYVIKQSAYVDTLGEFKKLGLDFVIDNRSFEDVDLMTAKVLPTYAPATFDPIESWEYLVLKDNREIYGADIQLRFNGKNEVLIYDEFVKQMPFPLDKKTNNLYFFAFDDRILTSNDINISDIIQYGETIEYGLTSIYSIGIEQPNWVNLDKTKVKCWGICTADYKVLIACNSNAETIYFKKGGNRLC